MDWLTNPDIWIGLATLTALEIVLGVDNVIFISLLAGKLPTRSADAGASTWLRARDGHPHRATLFTGVDHPADTALVHHRQPGDLRARPDSARWRSFLLAKATWEIHERLEGQDSHGDSSAVEGVVFSGTRADPPAGHRVLVGLGDHSRGYGR